MISAYTLVDANIPQPYGPISNTGYKLSKFWRMTTIQGLGNLRLGKNIQLRSSIIVDHVPFSEEGESWSSKIGSTLQPLEIWSPSLDVHIPKYVLSSLDCAMYS